MSGTGWVRVVGTSFAARWPASVLELHGLPAADLRVVRERDNAHDPQAVVLERVSTAERIGYLEREGAAVWAPLLDEGAHVAVRAHEIRGRRERSGEERQATPGLKVHLVSIAYAPDGVRAPRVRSSGAEGAEVVYVGDDRYAVSSVSTPGLWREVLIDSVPSFDAWCSCPSGWFREDRVCRHVEAVQRVLQLVNPLPAVG